VLRMGGMETPIPYSPVLEKTVVPQADTIAQGIRDLMRGRI
jgi:pyruvate/2-oxoglutarate/acetoin dehydrogenase E1 component